MMRFDFEYDRWGRVTKRVVSEPARGGWSAESEMFFTYSEAERTISYVDSQRARECAYDASGRVVSDESDHGDFGFRRTYTYDEFSRLVRMQQTKGGEACALKPGEWADSADFQWHYGRTEPPDPGQGRDPVVRHTALSFTHSGALEENSWHSTSGRTFVTVAFDDFGRPVRQSISLDERDRSTKATNVGFVYDARGNTSEVKVVSNGPRGRTTTEVRNHDCWR